MGRQHTRLAEDYKMKRSYFFYWTVVSSTRILPVLLFFLNVGDIL